jgi:hypothetical protein
MTVGLRLVYRERKDPRVSSAGSERRRFMRDLVDGSESAVSRETADYDVPLRAFVRSSRAGAAGRSRRERCLENASPDQSRSLHGNAARRRPAWLLERAG